MRINTKDTLLNVRPRSDLALDGRRLVRVRLAGEHRPMVIGSATFRGLQPSRLIRAFEAHCRSFISDSYISYQSALIATYGRDQRVRRTPAAAQSRGHTAMSSTHRRVVSGMVAPRFEQAQKRS